jgi:hypothetical protein
MKAPLLAGIKKYFDICGEEKELAAAASDQTRLLGRGRDPGRLLREEKMRKRVTKEKPRVSTFSFILSQVVDCSMAARTGSFGIDPSMGTGERPTFPRSRRKHITGPHGDSERR